MGKRKLPGLLQSNLVFAGVSLTAIYDKTLLPAGRRACELHLAA